MAKTSLILFIIILISALAFLAGYYFSGKNSSDTAVLSGSVLSGFETAANNTGKVASYPQNTNRPLNSERATSLAVSNNQDSVVYYGKRTGRIIELNYVLGTESIITNTGLDNFISSIWSPDKKSTISLFYNSSGNYYQYYDFKTKRVSVFKNNITAIAYSPDSKNIVYLQEGELGSSVYMALPDGSSRKKILNTRLQNIQLFWPAADKIYIQAISDKDNGSFLFRIDEAGNTLKLLDGGLEMQINFSPDGERFLTSYILNGELVTSLVAKNTEEVAIKQLLWANECAWNTNSDLIYCVSPGINKDHRPEVIEYGVLDGTSRQIGNLPFSGHVSLAILSTSENYLILLSKTDDKIYSIKLTR